ncbi:DUF3618 domain-containing protein [Streptomyces sp. NBC_00029]|uniref:DUF3618 domain-containing protein n=1 Tax=Streptomyces sp. NBC_00029 TaxID=2903613 RepID=UPI0032562BD7
MTSQSRNEPAPRRPAAPQQTQQTQQPDQPRQPTSGEPSAEELRERIEHTRDELGRTVEALAAKADVKAQAREKTAAMKEQATEKAALVTGRIRGGVDHAVHLAAEKTPDPVVDKARRAALLTVGAALIVFLLVRGNRRRHQ